MVQKQKAVVVSKFDQEKWQQYTKVEDRDVPDPQNGEVLVNVFLRPVNPTDVILVSTSWGGLVQPGAVPGSEGVAKVSKNGPGCSKFKEGQRVVAVQWPQFAQQGTWQQFVCVPEENLVAVHERLSDETAAQFFINPVTVVGMVREAGVPKGGWLLQAAATSVLGKQVISYCKHLGIKTINVVRRDSAKQEIKDAGGDEVISTESEDIVKRVKEITGGEGAAAALDPIGGKMTGQLAAALKKGGKYQLYGALSAPEPCEFDTMVLLSNGLVLTAFLIYGWIEQPKKAEILQEVMDLLVEGVITPLSGKKYPLAEVVKAIEHSQEVGRGAKLFLEG